MGTRGLTCVFANGEMKIAQYGQWDHYPEGAGLSILRFLRRIIEEGGLNRFRELCVKVSPLDEEEVKNRWREMGAGEGNFVSMEVANKVKNRWLHLSRDTGFDILSLVYNDELDEAYLNLEFPADSLFCEYAYVVDLDTNVYEVHRGLQEAPHSNGRFSGMTPARTGYYPVKEIAKFNLDSLPTEEEFLKTFDTDEKE